MTVMISGEDLRKDAVAGLTQAIHALTRPTDQAEGKASGSGSRGAYDALMRVWAIIELIEPSLHSGFGEYERESMERVVSKLTAGSRASAAAGLWRKLGKATPALAAEAKACGKRLRAVAHEPVALQRGRRLDPVAYRLVADLAEARARAERWPVDGVTSREASLDMFTRGLRGLYQRVRRRDRLRGRAPRQLAEALQRVEPSWPSGIKPFRKAAMSVAESAERVQVGAILQAEAGSRSALGAAARATMVEEEQAAAKAAGRLLVETPASFARRVTGYVEQAWSDHHNV